VQTTTDRRYAAEVREKVADMRSRGRKLCGFGLGERQNEERIGTGLDAIIISWSVAVQVTVAEGNERYG
jgi:hypothetical protein